MNRAFTVCALTSLALAATAPASVVLLSQQRTVTALNTFTGTLASETAPAFDPFVTSVSSSAFFPTAGGGTGTATATTTINCIVDPNAIAASGSLAGSGGFAFITGTPTPELGEASVLILVEFEVLAGTPFSLDSLARPSSNPGDVFEFRLRNLDTHDTIVEQDETMPPADVLLTGTLAPGHYELRYHAEMSVNADFNIADYGFNLQLPTPGAGAFLATVGVCSLGRRRRR